MKIHLRLLAFVTLTTLVVTSGRAQETYIFANTNANFGTGSTLGAGGSSAIQTFSNFNLITNATWTLTNTAGITQTASFNAYIGQWNTINNTLLGSLTSLGTVGNSLTLGAGLSTGLSFDGSIVVNANNTYALILTYVSGATTFAPSTGTNPGGTFFGTGNAITFAAGQGAGSVGTFATALQNPGSALDFGSGTAYTLSVTGVPEPKTASAIFGALFVAALVGHRIWQRRKQAAAPLAA